jgi:putative ABC transport system permease protein
MWGTRIGVEVGIEPLGDVLKEAKQVIRGLLRNPGFTLVAVLTMALSIGANTAMFSVIESVLLRPLPYRDPSRIVMLWSAVPSKAIERNWTSYPDIQDWRRESRSFTQIAAMLRVDTATLTGGAAVERIKTGRVSSEFFSTLGMAPQLGRTWTEQEEDRRVPAVVLSHAFWQTHFGGARDVIGKPLEIDHERAFVIGVMPADFNFPTAETAVWIPLSFISNWSAFLTARQADAFNAVARLKPGVTAQQAQQEMVSIGARLNGEYPQFEAGKSISVVSLPMELVGPRIRTGLWMLFGAVLFVLLIACTNVASLVLARQSSRERDSAVRLALGASRVRLIRSQLLECILLSLLTFCLLLSLITGVIFGIGPAWSNARRDPHVALKAGGRTIAGSLARRRLGSIFMALQLALAMVLVTGAGLMLRSFLQVQNADLGYQPQRLLFLHLDVPTEQGGEPAEFYQEALSRISAIPGIQSAGAIDGLFSDYVPDDVIEIQGRSQFSAGDEAAASGSHVVSGEFFQTASVPLLHGRFFASTDGPHSQPVAIINQSMAKRFWSGRNPLGQQFRYGVPGETPSAWRTVVGIVGDTLPDGPESQVFPQFFLPQTQAYGTASMDVVVRAAKNQLPLASNIRAAILSIKSDMPRFEVATVESEIERLGNRRSFQTWLLTAFSAVALVLAGIGVYGLISYSVAQRTSEIGIRMALGADRSKIMRMILGQLLTLTGIGLLLGLVGALTLSHAASSLLFGVAWTDGLTLASATSLLFVVALAAAYIPARRATRVDPVVALSSE